MSNADRLFLRRNIDSALLWNFSHVQGRPSEACHRFESARHGVPEGARHVDHFVLQHRDGAVQEVRFDFPIPWPTSGSESLCLNAQRAISSSEFQARIHRRRGRLCLPHACSRQTLNQRTAQAST
jgi:hypothetical protein